MASRRYKQHSPSAAEEHRFYQIGPDGRVSIDIIVRACRNEKIGAARLIGHQGIQGAKGFVEPPQLARDLKAGEALTQPLSGGIALLTSTLFQLRQDLHGCPPPSIG